MAHFKKNIMPYLKSLTLGPLQCDVQSRVTIMKRGPAYYVNKPPPGDLA